MMVYVYLYVCVCMYILYVRKMCMFFFIQMVINMNDKADESAQLREKKTNNITERLFKSVYIFEEERDKENDLKLLHFVHSAIKTHTCI